MTGIAPWLSVTDASEAVLFYEAAFGAVVLERHDDPDGAMVVALLSVDGADFWVQADPDATPEALAGEAIRMILSVTDPDAVFAAALAAGATEVAAVHEDFGWRIGRISDPAGHQWELGRRLSAG
jgi:PhnB protein